MGLSRSVWYAGYGSNLRASRLRAYLVGGTPTGSVRAHAGARDPRPADEVVTATLPGRLTFRGRFRSWGDGGAAFWDPTTPSPTGTWCRLYRLRAGQLVDLALQENGGDPRRREPAELAALEARIDALGAPGTRAAGATLGTGGPYDRVVRATATTVDGRDLDVVTVTDPDRRRAPVTAPPVAYVAVVLAGLLDDVGLDPATAHAYLLDAGVDPGTLAEAERRR